jgi:hypothetical protein
MDRVNICVWKILRYTSHLLGWVLRTRTRPNKSRLQCTPGVRFLMVELIQLGLNPRFGECVLYLRLIILSVGGGVSVDRAVDALGNRLRES